MKRCSKCGGINLNSLECCANCGEALILDEKLEAKQIEVKQMQIWEYSYLLLQNGKVKDWAEVVKLGEQGWEMVNAANWGDLMYHNYMLFFKRPKT